MLLKTNLFYFAWDLPGTAMLEGTALILVHPTLPCIKLSQKSLQVSEVFRGIFF